jgi:hypothetical protein
MYLKININNNIPLEKPKIFHIINYGKSKYLVCRKLVEDYPEWNPENFEKRTEEIVKWALKRWPH